MRGIYTPVTKIRRQVFSEIARLAFEGWDHDKVEELPYKIITGEVPQYRDSIFKERAIVGERIRLAMGLPLRDVNENAPVSKGLDDDMLINQTYEMPLVNVIPFACNACDETSFMVTDNCRHCLAHPCVSVCPVGAISFQSDRTVIDKEKCLKCGRCRDACPYSAIVKYERPCAAACGVNAIGSDHLGRAKIDPEKCVACGQCIVSCPFGAISDKSQLFQLACALKNGENIIAEVAPAFVGQFGPAATPEKVKAALKEVGFADVVEVAVGADIGTLEEAHHYAKEVSTGEARFLATSCCPAWSVMAKNTFPEIGEYMSQALTPMVATAREIKKKDEKAKVCFIGPCSAKKLEAMRRSIRSDVDYVITFEELMGIFVAKGTDFGQIEGLPMCDAAEEGRGYGVSGGVAQAIASAVHKLYPHVDVKMDKAEGLQNCKKMLALAKAGKREGYLLEGMACVGGCVAGAGTLQPINKATVAVNKFKTQSPIELVPDKK
ncbi:4Fe-4S dicluster domain-containing protein [Neobittarella massiliensis]|uniref:4Fe-4S dicluster domain-containing protein n=2 Tax=Oscillospiraceae TaxID=216572 RepID=A0A8J6IKG2_9FIRM|nr:4Fe-4S dicluster domain-containing protein [Neobittarella massiliensis]MBC3516236.1 4Fe-4S dicluster domain-containing protein [Neobittarella massiliensis]SCJ86305.1 Iron hydrogenase 1 [uncultured Anaerotruncus sp.]